MPITAANPAPFANPAASPPVSGWGTLSISDLLAVNNTSVIDFGRQDVFAAIAYFFEQVNAVVNDQLALFAARTTERSTGVGGPLNVRARFTDEFGVADSQKVAGAAQMGFPLRKSQVARQWTFHWMRRHTPADLAAEAQAAAIADLNIVQYSLRRAIFVPTNSTFIDVLRDFMPVYVKAFANADGFPILPSPSGVLVDPTTHNHYLATTNVWPTPADIDATVTNVSEHVSAGRMYLFVPLSLGNYLYTNRASTYTDFAPLQYPDQQYATTLTLATGQITPQNPQNRRIGVWKGADVWVKPWIPDGYLFAFCDTPVKALAMRVPDDLGGDNGDFRPVFNDSEMPLECEVLEREFGFGVRNRTAGAVLQYNGNDTTYDAPTLTY